MLLIYPCSWLCRYALVWDEAGKTYQEMLAAEGWDKRSDVSIPTPEDITMKVTISFGLRRIAR